MLKIATVVGARPQFIKASAVSRVLVDDFAQSAEEVLIHTGQHFDDNMSKVFFDELEIPEPLYNLGVAGGGHGAMTGRMLEGLERVLLEITPDWVLVYGDTNSTLAGALAAVKLHIPVAHVEAGLRSHNMRMPEEINRILADRVSTRLFCPTEAAVTNLHSEGITRGVSQVGDVMYDVALNVEKRARVHSDAMRRLGLEKGRYVLATCHRAENTDDRDRLHSILGALAEIAEVEPVILALHPRTRHIVERNGATPLWGRVTVIEPLSFLDMAALEKAARVVVTDSGGVQKEAFFYGVPCVTMRDETEWVETVAVGANRLTGADRARIVEAVREARGQGHWADLRPYGDGHAARRIVKSLLGAAEAA